MCPPSEQVSTAILNLRDELADLKKSLAYLDHNLYPQHLKVLNANALAKKTFDVPELLEHILSFLRVSDLLDAQQVSRQFLCAIRSSTKLQRQLGFQAHEDTHVYTPMQYMKEISVTAESNRLDLTGGDKIMLTVRHDKLEGLRRIGKRFRRMLICQPPIKRLGVFPSCCTDDFIRTGDRVPVETITSETGITVGDIVDTVLRVVRDHRLCPHAGRWLHDKDGFVTPRVVCETVVDVQPDDPLLLEKQSAIKRTVEARSKQQALFARFAPYIAAKQQAHQNGQHIPTLAEFEAAQESEKVDDQ